MTVAMINDNLKHSVFRVRSMASVSAPTTPWVSTVRNVRTSTTTTPGGLPDPTSPTSVKVRTILAFFNPTDIIVGS